MNLHRKPIPVGEAIQRVMNVPSSTKIEKIPLEQADERILAQEVAATHAIPPFDKSPYDGFAIKAEDTAHATKEDPMTFRVTEEIGAGHRASKPLQSGEAVRIMTGAEIPEGATCVAMFEICHTHEQDGQSYMTIKREMQPDQNIIKKASETKEGTPLVSSGTAVNPGVKALLATFGYSEVEVYKKPVVGVFATGTELLDIDQPLEPGKIRNSNAYMVLSQVNRSGAEAKYFGKLADDFDTCYKAITEALQKVDVLITTGGVSVGDYDLMPLIYEKLGAEVLFNKIGMRPGSVTTVAHANGQLLFGLSGNPSACYVGFELYTYPYLQKMLDRKNPYHPVIDAALGTDFGKPNPFTRFIRGYISYEEGKVVVYPAGMDKSAVVTSLAKTNVLIVLKGGTRGYQKGEGVQAILLEDETGSEEFLLEG
ncbi:molybdopterin molybdenumtransferase [Halobacillus andaensis]|uniref:Molybdopterin molybdenumtransferase n=1 Tax=Halobacillus andaensis TaxID=1176239 RepID=A0A917B160_HALAA|nr:gephyrin-like molybdotransferase Glp [Halobacillus andaensis]MBP2003700.1 molybdopterin molybdotransferase [Halobacillus andaensis]GGF12564.1 molybdopterin molybdenumtransferase [Halobacillus andaensis]